MSKQYLSDNFIKFGGLSTQFLMADGSITSTSAITISFSGTTNFLQKITASSGLTNSLIYDDSTGLGIATTGTTAYTINIGSQNNRSIGVESNLTGDGKSLTIAGGNGIPSTAITFTMVNTGQIYDGVTVAPNGDVYRSSNISQQIYKQTSGIGSFVSLAQTARGYWGMASNLAGDIYVVVGLGDIYKQTGGIGNFIGIGETSRQWRGIAVNSINGDVYACVDNGDIYKQTGGIGLFVALGQTSRQWVDLEELNGDIYATAHSDGIYKQTGGVGNFISLSFGQNARGIGKLNGDIYVDNLSGDVYKQTSGIGAFVQIGSSLGGSLYAIAGGNNKLYVAGTLYGESNAIVSIGGNLILQTGLGTGNGINSIDFKLGLINTSGITQSLATKMSLANNGDLTLTGRFIKTGGLGTQFLMADGSVTTGTSGGSVTFTGTTNYIQKLDANSAMTNSLIHDNGIGLGIGTTAFTTNATTIQLGSQTNRKIAIETIINDNGKNLSLQGGNSIDATAGITNPESFTLDTNSFFGRWNGMCADNSNNIYYAFGEADIYFQANGTGSFTALGQPAFNWYGMCCAPNNDIYALAFNGDIYKRTGGVGNFIGLGQTARQWFGMCSAPNGDIFAVVVGGGIYKQTGGVGNFIDTGETNRSWTSITRGINNNFYATVAGDDVYKQTNGTGAFVAMGLGVKNYYGVTTAPNGDIYVAVYNDDIYVIRFGTNTLTPLSQSNLGYASICCSSNYNLFTGVFNGNTYKSLSITSSQNLSGGSLSIETGTGYGNASNSIDFVTATPVASAGGVQTKSTKMKILGNGNIQMTSIPTFADNTAAISGGLTIGTLYKTSTGVLMIVI